MNVIVFDTETTGLGAEAEVIQLAVAVMDSETFEVIEQHETLIKPKGPIQEGASKIHGLYAEDVKDAPSMDEVLESHMGKLLCEAMFVMGHNVPFDIRMMREPWTQGVHPMAIDTLTIARVMFRTLPNHKLPTLMEQLKLPERSSHDALSDVLTCVDILQHLRDNHGWTFKDVLECASNGITRLRKETSQSLRNLGRK